MILAYSFTFVVAVLLGLVLRMHLVRTLIGCLGFALSPTVSLIRPHLHVVECMLWGLLWWAGWVIVPPALAKQAHCEHCGERRLREHTVLSPGVGYFCMWCTEATAGLYEHCVNPPDKLKSKNQQAINNTVEDRGPLQQDTNNAVP